MVRVIGPRDRYAGAYINTTSRSTNWSRGLSPFFAGPVSLYGAHQAVNVENGWQYSKVYRQHVDAEGDPTADYWAWAKAGWRKAYADRYPMGKGATPLYSWWDGEKLDYITARQRIYVPLYSQAVRQTTAWALLEEEYTRNPDLVLWDFDGYDHRALGMSYQDVILCDTRKMGHAFVLAMMLEGAL